MFRAELLFAKCNPNAANVCLYGYPNGMWEVCMPSEEVPSELPEPVLGINYARDGMSVLLPLLCLERLICGYSVMRGCLWWRSIRIRG